MKSPAEDTWAFTTLVTSHSPCPLPLHTDPASQMALQPSSDVHCAIRFRLCAMPWAVRTCLQRYAVHTVVLGSVMTVREAWRTRVCLHAYGRVGTQVSLPRPCAHGCALRSLFSFCSQRPDTCPTLNLSHPLGLAIGIREVCTLLVACVWHLGMCLSEETWAPAPLGRVVWSLRSTLC